MFWNIILDDSSEKMFSKYPSNIDVFTKLFSIPELVPEDFEFHALLL